MQRILEFRRREAVLLGTISVDLYAIVAFDLMSRTAGIALTVEMEVDGPRQLALKEEDLDVLEATLAHPTWFAQSTAPLPSDLLVQEDEWWSLLSDPETGTKLNISDGEGPVLLFEPDKAYCLSPSQLELLVNSLRDVVDEVRRILPPDVKGAM